MRILDNLSVGTRERLSHYSKFSETPANSNEYENHLLPGDVELVIGDIRDYKTCRKSCRGVDTIVHLAANTGVQPSIEDPQSDMNSNVIGTVNLLEAARQENVKRFVFASSGAPIGNCTPPIHEELAPHPVSPYGASKLAGEGYCSAYYHSFGIETVALRFGNVYGPGSGHKNSVIAKFIRQAMNGETLEIYGDGTQTRDFIYIDDLLQAIWLAATVPGIGGEIFQIATNRETSIIEIRDFLIPILEEKGYKGIDVKHAAPLAGDVKRNFSDTTKAKNRLGWQAEKSFLLGLKETVTWFIKQEIV